VSQIAASRLHGHDNGHSHGHEEPHVAARRRVDLNTVTLAPGSGRMLSSACFFIGLVGIVVTLIGAKAAGEHGITHALAAYHTGFMYCVGLAVACLGMQMIFQQMNAGWAAPVRRQAENVASCVWVCGVLFAPLAILEVFVFHGKLFHWMQPGLTDPAAPNFDILAQKKAAFLNGPFWLVRAVLYFGLWMFFAGKLASLSRQQDATGDKWLTAKARKLSSIGLLVFALSSAFAAFDWLMSMDYHFFSTMFGVYFFAGAIRAAAALTIVILGTLMIRGKLGAAYTKEHLHDNGKLLFAFTVFWAYISFCQYFLIWYSNIPEETAFYNLRVTEAWQPFPMIVVLFNFVIPFLLLLIRNFKRNPRILVPIAIFCMVAYSLDLYFIVRPMVHGALPWENLWLDVMGLVGPLGIFLGFVVRKVCSTPLIPLKDPRLHEVLEHTNYV
jgi:hypothetical protein